MYNKVMNLLRVQLFQNLQVTTADGQPIDLGSPTTRALFVYLLLHRGRQIDRRRLAFSFWKDAPEAAARRNLRQYLHRLRRALEAAGVPIQKILIEEPSLQFVEGDEVWVDVEVFQEGSRPQASLEAMAAAAALYTGDLLPEIYDEWCEQERCTLRNEYINLLDRLSQTMQNLNRVEEAIAYATRWTQVEPLDEAAHRRLMSAYALAGDRHRALQQYQGLQARLQRELESPPLPETQALAKSIQSGAFQQESLQASHPRVRLPAAVENSSDLELVDRQEELERLEDVFKDAQNGAGGLVLISGESGIGKTRLVVEYLNRHPGLTVLQGTGHELEAAVPYASLRQLFAEAASFLPPALVEAQPVWLQSLATYFPTLLGRPAHRQAMASPPAEAAMLNEPLSRLVVSLADAQPPGKPLHFILDDLQWADGLTWDFLGLIARQATGLPLVILGLCRLEDLPRERARLIRTLERSGLLRHFPLKRLTLDETKELSRQVLPSERMDDLFILRLHKESEGIPFFVIEMARALQENARLAATPGGMPGFVLPISIQRVIEARLDRLSQPGQALLAVAAAIGRAFTFQFLLQVSQAPGLSTTTQEAVVLVEEWLQRGLVREVTYTSGRSGRESPSQRYDFAHDKIRQVAYASLSQARRQYVHRSIAEVFETSIPPAEPATLAYHFARSDQPLRALPYLTRAGEQALQIRSYQEARQFGLRAVSLLGRMPGPRERTERLDLNLQLAQAYAFTGDLDRALEIIQETERLADSLGDAGHLAQIFHRSAQLFWLRGQPQAAGDYARRTLRFAEDLNDERLQQAALRMLGRVGIALSMYDDAITYLQRYANQPRQPPDLAIVKGYLGVAYARVGGWNRAMQAAQEGLELAEREGSSQAISFARMQLGFVYADLRKWDLAQETIQPVPDPLEGHYPLNGEVTSAEPLQLTPVGFMLLGLRGRILAHQGNAQAGIATIRPALEWAERVNYRVFHYLPRLFLGESLFIAQKYAQAIQETALAVEHARAAGNRWAVGIGLRLLADSQFRLPNPNWAQVEDHLIESMELLRQVRARPDLARTFLSLRRLYDRVGQIAWAVDCHFRATTIYEELDMLEDLRSAQGQAGGERRGAAVVTGVQLRGPNLPKP
jgi:DNA-binding SARP family transcriptional activator